MVGFVMLVAAAALALAAKQAPRDLTIMSGIITALCLPVGYFLRNAWREKFRLEVLIEILPALPPREALGALERYSVRDTSPTHAPDAAHPPRRRERAIDAG
jgi:hypothetical protein